MNEMQGGDLGLQDRIQIYNASYSYYQPCHAAVEISSRKAIIMLYFSGRVCYDLAGVRPVTTEISFEALEKMPFPYDMEDSENLSLR